MYDADLITYEEYQAKKTRIEEEYEDERMKLVGKAFDIMGDAASTYSQLVANMQNREISKIEKKYDKQIKAAQKQVKTPLNLKKKRSCH